MSETGSAAEPGVVTPAVVTKASPRTVADTVSKLTGMIAAKGLTLFAVIDQREAAQKAGLDLRDTVLVVFGSPAAGTPVMAAVPLAALDLPLKTLIWDDGGQTKVSYYDPAALAAWHQVPGDLAGNLAAINGLTDALDRPVPPQPCADLRRSMTRFIKDDDFDDQFARTLSAAASGCADLGEAFATATDRARRPGLLARRVGPDGRRGPGRGGRQCRRGPPGQRVRVLPARERVLPAGVLLRPR